MNVNQVQNTQTYSPAKKVAKVVAGTVATAAVVAAGLAVGAKTGKFATTAESSAIAKKILPHLDKAGKYINTKTSEIAKKVVESPKFQEVATKVKESGIKEKAEAKVAELSKKIKETGISEKAQVAFDKAATAAKSVPGHVKSAVSTLADKIERVFTNPEKWV